MGKIMTKARAGQLACVPPVATEHRTESVILDPAVWRQVDTGVWLHRTEPRILLVEQELDQDRLWPVSMSEEEWVTFRLFLLTHVSWESEDPLLTPRRLSEVQIVRRIENAI